MSFPFRRNIRYRRYKTEPNRKTRSGEGGEGGRFTGSTEDSGPKKLGNSVEEKTLTIRRIEEKEGVFDREPAACDGKHTSDPKASNRYAIGPECSKIVIGTWEAVNERR